MQQSANSPVAWRNGFFADMLRLALALALALALTCANPPSDPDTAECITDSCVGCIDDCLTPQSED